MGTEPRLHFHAKAPTRIDLAGGTIDLWPIYLFLPEPKTINLAIDLYAEAELEQTPAHRPGQGRVKLRSEDQGIEGEWSWDALLKSVSELRSRACNEGAAPHPALVLHYRLLRYFADRAQHSVELPKIDVAVRTRAKSPAGAGLGGSSTLSVALVGAIAAWERQGAGTLNPATEGQRYIDLVRDVETTVIQVPAGLQDYYGAMFGGLQSLRWLPAHHQHQHLAEDLLRETERRILLFYSGQSRNSGINNWALFKSCIDNENDVRERFVRIAAAANELERALSHRDWAAAGRAIADEWATRKTLAPGITTPEMDAAFSEARALVPSLSGKVCGAGGGGCFFLYSPEPFDSAEMRLKAEKIREAFTNRGIRPLPFRAVAHGLETRTLDGPARA